MIQQIIFLSLTSCFVLSACQLEKKKRTNYTCDNIFPVYESNSTRITSGCENNVEEIPGTKSTVFLEKNSNICTGVAIGNKTILTAAHCFDNGSTISIASASDNGKKITGTVIVNPFHRRLTDEEEKNLKNNPYHIPFADIAIVQTNISLRTIGIEPAKIILSYNNSDKFLTFGFGKENVKDESSNYVKRWTVLEAAAPGSINLVGEYLDRFINMKNNSFYSSIQNVSETFVELKRLRGQTCLGDSGGPHFKNVNGTPAVVALTQGVNTNVTGKVVTSDENNECSASSSVATYIAPYIKWIKANSNDLEIID